MNPRSPLVRLAWLGAIATVLVAVPRPGAGHPGLELEASAHAVAVGSPGLAVGSPSAVAISLSRATSIRLAVRWAAPPHADEALLDGSDLRGFGEEEVRRSTTIGSPSDLERCPHPDGLDPDVPSLALSTRDRLARCGLSASGRRAPPISLIG